MCYDRERSELVGPAPAIGLVVSIQLPGILDHQVEVLIIVNTAGDVVIVLGEFLEGDPLIPALALGHHGVVLLEGVQELTQHFLFGLLALSDLRMLLGIVDILDIGDVYDSALVLIQFVEGLPDHLDPGRVHLTSYSSQELVIGDLAIGVLIEETVHTDHVVMAES